MRRNHPDWEWRAQKILDACESLRELAHVNKRAVAISGERWGLFYDVAPEHLERIKALIEEDDQ